MLLRSEKTASSHAATILAAGAKQRRHFRQKIHNLAYINLDYSNGGIIRNVSESGIAIQVVSPIDEDQEVQLRFDLLNPRARVEARARVAWTDGSGQAGLEFLAITPRSRRQLKEWLFTQVLGVASQSAATGTIFIAEEACEPAPKLTVGSVTVPVIQMTEKAATVEQRVAPETLPWYPIPESPRTLARMIDGLIIAAAVLMFSLIALAMTHVFPAWPSGLALIAATTAVFTAIYWFLFVSWIGLTPGGLLAGMAGGILQDSADSDSEEIPRFR
jgi:hypothetical protein